MRTARRPQGSIPDAAITNRVNKRKPALPPAHTLAQRPGVTAIWPIRVSAGAPDPKPPHENMKSRTRRGRGRLL
nr:hypothetical protein SHINE37_40877 [Rhizobiaceae bacterium]